MLSKFADILEKMISVAIDGRYPDAPPTEEEFMTEALDVRQRMGLPVSDEEFGQIVRNLQAAKLVAMDVGVYIQDRETDHQSWLPARRADIDFFYWNRYKRYLELHKGWNTRVTATLDTVSTEIVDLLGDPQSDRPWLRRGLVLGDVQSGKTANYTAVCNKAADAGYKVIIVLAGMLDNLRIQTQERLDKEFAGRQSKDLLSANNRQIKNVFDGVGKIDPRKRISAFTTVATDFSAAILKSHDLTLHNLVEPALFVVKKNKTVLNNLESWLMGNNADANGKINIPLLLIDDEADHASINTRKPEEDPTAINAAIRSILNRFSQASYLGITATPFANIFINPETNSDMVGEDLFPQDFIYVLSPPTSYIGPNAIFGSGARFSSSLVEIKEDEMKHYYPFRHKKHLAVQKLPPSMLEALGYFVLVNAIRDLRGDSTDHRSMLINVSRFTGVQNDTKDLVNEWLVQTRSDLGNYARLAPEQALKIESIAFLKSVWEKHGLAKAAGVLWEVLQREYLHRAAAPIEVRAINQSPQSSSLDYYKYKESGLRVIAVGGNSLSRGLTLEGLCVSYIYRNSKMYDTLLQLGRWFGYRSNYEDLFRIWMADEALDWYGYITEAVVELKEEIGRMNQQNLTPRHFGLKVRQDPRSLIVTALNKMRSATMVKRPISVQGRLLETPRLKSKPEVLAANERVFKLFASRLGVLGSRVPGQKHLWTGIPKQAVADLLRSFETHPWHLAFQGRALADYLDSVPGLEQWDVVIPSGESTTPYGLDCGDGRIEIFRQRRTIIEAQGMLKVSGTKVRVGSVGCTRAGLTPGQIEAVEAAFRAEHPDRSPSDSAYLIPVRNPLLMLHVLEAKPEPPGDPKIPETLFAIGIGLPRTDEEERTANYMINLVELRNWTEVEDDDDEDVADAP